MRNALTLFFIISISFSSMMNHFNYNGQYNGIEKINFQLGDIQLSQVADNYKFDYNYTGFVMEEGMPELPVFTTMIEIEPGFNYTVKYNLVSYQTHSNKPIRATGEMTLDKAKHDNGLIRQMTRHNIFPEEQVKLSEPMVMRGIEIIHLEVIPFSFNPAINELISYDEFKIVFDPIMKGPLTLLSDKKVKTLNYEQR